MLPDPADQIRQILAGCSPDQREAAVRLLRHEYRIHRIEREWNTSADVILEALARSGELTRRMFKGILAEAACKVDIIDKLTGWNDATPEGSHAFDFVVERAGERVTIQTKLQRKEGGQVKFYKKSRYFVVETQKTRKGDDSGGGSTRPYRFGEFDILAVSLEPSTGDWARFRFTVGDWLIPRRDNADFIAVLQPVAPAPNDEWTDDLPTAIEWLRRKTQRTITVISDAIDQG